MKIFFCYERDRVSGKWCPVIYYSEAPEPGVNGKESELTRFPKTCWEEKTDLDTDKPGVIDFLMMALMKRHPAPQQESKT